MSSSAKPSPDAAAAAAASNEDTQTDVADDENLQLLLKIRGDEIASLKKENRDLKKTIAAQKMELSKLKDRIASQDDSCSPDGLAKTSIEDVVTKKSKNSSSTTSKMEARWKTRFQELAAYKLEHGDCNVPKSYKDKSLHAWVRTQREGKKDFDKRKPVCSMTQERIDALNSIGFQWYVGHQPKDDAWDSMFQALLQYKQQHGHTRVSTTENKQLYKWVLNQRARRRLLEANGEGKAKGMTWARVEKLSAIDFLWEANPRRPPPAPAPAADAQHSSPSSAVDIVDYEDEPTTATARGIVAQFATGEPSPTSPGDQAALPAITSRTELSTAAAASPRTSTNTNPNMYKFEAAAAV